jgi:D-tyrosyl-tRNA(Tyr) deacylase
MLLKGDGGTMIGLIQRVSNAKVEIEEQVVGQIEQGILLLLGVQKNDAREQVEKLVAKVINCRIFSDENGKMNLNIKQVEGKLLVVSQFTLAADTKKGNRPGFSNAGEPTMSKALYEDFIRLAQQQGIDVETGKFGADMQVTSCNDGPVTFWLEV